MDAGAAFLSLARQVKLDSLFSVRPAWTEELVRAQFVNVEEAMLATFARLSALFQNEHRFMIKLDKKISFQN